MSTRPRYPKPDGNHLFVKRFVEGLLYYQGLPLSVRDTSKFGGLFLDWLLWIGDLCIEIEVKIPGKETRLQPGERATLTEGHPAALVTNDADLLRVLEEYAPLAEMLRAARR